MLAALVTARSGPLDCIALSLTNYKRATYVDHSYPHIAPLITHLGYMILLLTSKPMPVLL